MDHVGIDLGTTHTVVAFSTSEAPGRTEALPLPQLVSAHETNALTLLPSFLYTPPAEEDVADPWQERPWVVGRFARERGQEVSERLVASAKSWLSHAGVARRDAILPWGADAAHVPKISPVEASRRLLSHVRRSWDGAFPDRPLAEQSVVLTVPASFDEVARELTVEAAQQAGLRVRLLEEPQAAFYDLIAGERRRSVEALLTPERPSATVLVCDVGGGTTDLTLIQVRRDGGGELELERVAVGRHLLLGGDNIDLTLAQLCEERLLGGADRLDAQRFSRLLLACRGAKEAALGPSPPDSVPIRVAGLGSALIGSTLACELQRTEVEELVFTGFLPMVGRGEPPPRPRSGLLAFGLPYERDPAISRHVVQFLERHASAGVDALLLNGGLFHARRAAERVQEVVASWCGRDVALLPYPEPDLSVARGAVAFSHSLGGRGLRIGGGTPRGFYVSVDERAARRALCVVPKGAREGERHEARSGGLWLRVGEPVQLELYTSDSATHRAGEIVTLDDDFVPLPPVTTLFSHAVGEGEPRRELEVALEGELSAIGTVELGCVELHPEADRDARHFRLAFELRAAAQTSEKSRPPAPSRPPPPRLAEALEAIRRVFGEGRPDVKERESRDLPRELERLLGERREWTLETNRALFDAVAEGRAGRRRSEDHERVFWMLAGYCLRPGFGAPLDDQRLAQLVPLFEAGMASAAKPRSWQQFWIAWRRVVAGLREETQTRLLGLLEPFWAPSELKLKRSKSLKAADASYDMLELLASLERVPADRRKQLGDWLIERTFQDRDPRLWSALGRVGARVPGYASAHHVVAPSAAENWLTHLLSERWHEVPTAAATAVQLARVTSDRARDIAPSVREEVARRLEAVKAEAELVAMVREHVPQVEAERAAWFGEELPVGLRLGSARGD